MTLLQLLLLLAAVGAVAAALLLRLDGGLAPATSTRPHRPLPDVPLGALEPQAVDDVRFSLGLRGYRMDEVDAVLDRLRDELRARDEELAGLRAPSDVVREPVVEEA